jgi:PIN domain nuclease of toxin-antitoxin system
LTRAFFDTHVAYWLAKDSDRLSPSLVANINRHQQRAVSSLSFAELEIKHILGRAPEFADLSERFASMAIEIEPFDYVASRSVARFPTLMRHDPFDRMIFAQAASRPNTTFFTADKTLIALGLDWVIDART